MKLQQTGPNSYKVETHLGHNIGSIYYHRNRWVFESYSDEIWEMDDLKTIVGFMEEIRAKRG